MKKPLMKLILLVAASAIAFSQAVALIDSQVVRTAQHAIRREVNKQLGAGYHVSFDNAQESFLSLTETTVSGKAYLFRAGEGSDDRPFTYSIKVKNDGSRSRDLKVKFSDGGTLASSGGGWVDSKPGKGYIRLNSPTWMQNFSGPSVRFEGEASEPVTISIYDSRNNLVKEVIAETSRGEFGISVRLDEGTYRAHLHSHYTDSSDGVRFVVSRFGSGGGFGQGSGQSGFRIDSPARDASLKGPRVSISGRSSERNVKVVIYDSRNRVVTNRTVPTRDRYWNTEIELGAGSYSCRVESGRDRESREFTVRGGPVTPPAFLTLTDPRQDAALDGTRATVAGNSSAKEVRVRVYDFEDNLVTDRRVPTRDNYFNTSIVLKAGKYRVVVDFPGSNLSVSRNFRMKLEGSPTTPVVAVKISSPQRDSTVKGPTVYFAGQSSDSEVTIQVFDSRKNVVAQTTARVRGGNWSTSLSLNSGSYRLRATPRSGRDFEEFWFKVK
ncbi:MAG: hypothetical protein U0R49_04865 [Fimbriimonadales bacterium]